MTRRGLTLIELLIVVTLTLALTVVVFSNLTEPRQRAVLRESARAIQALFQRARAEAQATGRSVGVELSRLPGGSRAVLTLRLVESKGVYTGDTLSSKIWVGGTGLARLVTSDRGWIGLLNPGDLIRFNHQGRFYALQGHSLDAHGCFTAASHPWTVLAGSESLPVLPITGVPFEVFLKPTKAATADLQLPGNAAIDLSASGTHDELGLAGEEGAVTVVFGASGSVERMFVGASSATPSGPIYLLLGLRENCGGDGFASQTPNLSDPDSLWVRVDVASGRVSAHENVVEHELSEGVADLFKARQLAIAGAPIGGH